MYSSQFSIQSADNHTEKSSLRFLSKIADGATGLYQSAGSAVSAAARTAGGFASSAYGGAVSLANMASGYIQRAEHGVTRELHAAEDWVDQASHSLAGRVANVPVLGSAARGLADQATMTTQLAGGVLGGASTMVGGICNAALHPIDTASGVEAMAEHTPGPLGTMTRGAHDLIDVARGRQTAGGMIERAVNPTATRKEDEEFWGRVGSAVIDPYRQSIKEGRSGEAIGRGAFDIGSMLLGVGEIGEAGRGAGVAGEVGRASDMADAARAASTAGDAKAVSKVGEYSTAGEMAKAEGASDLAKSSELSGARETPGQLRTAEEETAATKPETGNAAQTEGKSPSGESSTNKSADQRGEKLEDSHTSEATREHVHKGGTEADPRSPYHGKWDGKGIHEWDELVQRCKKDGYEIKSVAEDPKTGVRRVTIERIGIDPKNKAEVRGTIKKTIYPKSMDAKQIDLAGERALEQAIQKAEGTKLEPYGTKKRADGTPADGYFEATTDRPKGEPLRVQGWFAEGKDGKKTISSHAPRFDNNWPKILEKHW